MEEQTGSVNSDRIRIARGHQEEAENGEETRARVASMGERVRIPNEAVK